MKFAPYNPKNQLKGDYKFVWGDEFDGNVLEVSHIKKEAAISASNLLLLNISLRSVVSAFTGDPYSKIICAFICKS